ncbi:hypothetical protein TCAL_07882 [Tigriopus californicus]|uniref:BHLH domain-containing protein n=1 Tax=Tigriopus californicus TaxID=6832 RepID=A0A553P845_TIGCA|nr:achaete-scute homolog 1-like [Tigriopus californicus]TRY73847.1 hypothetical protein TCAL_07882 [Tigriopus californicus]|eukprot:TCALIF_07882-PA protein Name:"Similar to sc Achaete-scute complex protein T4 (Drosophila melanogaster)" AED:0.24 eAED:0.28 QI:0/-1/0/1/-1/1/1/0/290
MNGLTSNFRLVLPQSPVKPSVLQPVINNGTLLLSNSSPIALKSFQDGDSMPEGTTDKPIMARADSTGGRENKAGKKVTSKRSAKNGSTSSKNEHPASVPFVKHHHSVKKPQTPSVSRRNARERNRVKQVNDGFLTLRSHIPNVKGKTSKVDTLRAAVDYIQALRRLIGEDPSMDPDCPGPIFTSESFEDYKSMNDSGMSSPPRSPRSGSSLSNGELNPLVYQLPPVSVAEFSGLDHSRISPNPSVSPKSEHMGAFDGSGHTADTSSFLDGSSHWWTTLAVHDPMSNQSDA